MAPSICTVSVMPQQRLLFFLPLTTWAVVAIASVMIMMAIATARAIIMSLELSVSSVFIGDYL